MQTGVIQLFLNTNSLTASPFHFLNTNQNVGCTVALTIGKCEYVFQQFALVYDTSLVEAVLLSFEVKGRSLFHVEQAFQDFGVKGCVAHLIQGKHNYPYRLIRHLMSWSRMKSYYLTSTGPLSSRPWPTISISPPDSTVVRMCGASCVINAPFTESSGQTSPVQMVCRVQLMYLS